MLFHKSVLLKETIDYLRVEKGKKYIDATLGGGGHGVEILKKGGIVLGIDVDEEAISYTSRRWKLEARNWKISENNWILVRGNFKDLKKIALSNGFQKVSGILFDLGVSSHQIESEDRGFSFQKDSVLDMRMDKSLKVTAADLINGLTKEELNELFTKLAQENLSWAISNRLVRARKIKPIKTTRQLASLIEDVYRRHGMKRSRINPATRVFQALRIVVNDELNNLREALPQAASLLDWQGRLVVISFHSLEDRIVKNFYQEQERMGNFQILTQKPVVPSLVEIKENPRARSAKMRVLEKNE